MASRRLTVSGIVINLLFIAASILCIVPMLLVLSVSLSDEQSVLLHGYRLIPEAFSLKAYEYIFTGSSPLPQAYLVTVAITLAGTFLHLLLSGMLAYTLARRELAATKVVSMMLIICLLFNGGLVPTYILLQRYLHLKDTIFVLFVPYLLSSVNVMILRNFFSTIPDSIVESARIDGSGEFNTFIRMVVPLSTPALATIGLFTAVFLWNDWFTSALYIYNPKLYTLQFLLQAIMANLKFLQGNVLLEKSLAALPNETARMATCILAVGPIILAYPYLQRYFVKGLTLGAVKQ